MSDIRIDKWLWAVRIFKTRTLASDECKRGLVKINDLPAKPSRTISIGDVVKVRKNSVNREYKVLDVIGKRVGAKLVPEFMKDITPDSELEIIEMKRLMSHAQRDRGAGRPTKRDRRVIDKMHDNNIEDYDSSEE